MTNKKKKELLRAQVLCALLLGGQTMLGGAVADAALYVTGDYNDDIDTTEDISVDRYNTVNLNGNLKVSVSPGSDALYAYGTNTPENDALGILRINMNKTKTVQINGNIHRGPSGDIDVKFSNANSYFAGSNNGGELSFSNGATWYVSGASATGIVDAAGGNINLWHATPTTVTRSTAGNRTVSVTGTGTSLNGATFIVSSNAAAGTADTVALTGAGGSNTYTVKVAYDPSATETGEYTVANGGATVLTSNNAGDTVVSGDYTATAVTSAGLLTKTLKYTPTLAVDNTGGTTAKLTKLTVTDLTEGTGGSGGSAGPAATMASAASAAQLAALGGWRAENNDLQRRLGDLRWDKGNAGAWARAYGGESQIHSGAGSDVSYHGIQVGYDRARSFGEGKLFTGIAFSNMKGDASGSAGSSDIDSKLFGVYGSYLGAKGHFIDAIIKYGRFTNDTNRIHNNITYAGDYGTNGLNMSLEYGYHKQLHNGFYLEPQAELNYSHLNSSSYTMNAGGASGAFVQNNGVDSLIARVGVNAGRSTKDGNIYLKLSCLHEFNGDTGMTATYNGTTVNSSSSGSDTWLEYGVGFNQRVGKNQNLYGEIMRTACADKVSDNWKANLGWRVSF